MNAVYALETPRPRHGEWIDWFEFKLALMDVDGRTYVVLALPHTAPPDNRFDRTRIDNQDVQLLKIIEIETTRCVLLDRNNISSLDDILGFQDAVTRVLDALALMYCSPDSTQTQHFEVFSEIRLVGSTTHAVLLHPGLCCACSLFEVEPIPVGTLAKNFANLPPRQRAGITEFFRTIRWWKHDMWEESGEAMPAFTEEKRVLFDTMGLREHGTAVPPRRQTGKLFEWGALQCDWKDYRKGTAPSSLHQLLCVEISPDWCLKPLPESLCCGNSLVLGYYSDDFLTVHGIGILADSTVVEKDAAADMCYLLNASLSGYNCDFEFDYRVLKDLGNGSASVELLGTGAALQNIAPGFVAFRSALTGRDSLGLYEFLDSYADLTDEAKASLCIMSNILCENARVSEEARTQHIEPIENRTCIMCARRSTIYYNNYRDLCFCDMDCLRRAINPIIGEGTTFSALLSHFQ
jgi:hypothetical protein